MTVYSLIAEKTGKTESHQHYVILLVLVLR